MNVEKLRNSLSVLVFSVAVFTTPLVLAGLAGIDLGGEIRVTPATMGALEVATAAPVPDPVPSPPAAAPPAVPLGLALRATRVP